MIDCFRKRRTVAFWRALKKLARSFDTVRAPSPKSERESDPRKTHASSTWTMGQGKQLATLERTLGTAAAAEEYTTRHPATTEWPFSIWPQRAGPPCFIQPVLSRKQTRALAASPGHTLWGCFQISKRRVLGALARRRQDPRVNI
ncbi:hypothetical protein MRX96_041864 [Rhipicephalus microplus]